MDRLSKTEINALDEALDDEYKAWATYDQVIEDFGPVRPFINIRESESRHIDALHQLYSDYGLAPPDNDWIGKAPHFESVKSACAAGVQGEIDNLELYKRIKQSTDREDILRVFDNLSEASQQRHLPAFERCLQRRRYRGDCD
tara:strand:+ start:3339 stop:3767 length:429 start_codon:yes stop_codon:yes gene_type:complete